MTTLHFRSIRMRNNAGMDFPECKTREALLDLDASALPTTGQAADVTCQDCRASILEDPWHLSPELLQQWEDTTN